MNTTPRAQLQSLARLMHLHGDVQYISQYARNTGATAQSGWYILVGFRRLRSGLLVWDSGVWLGYDIATARQVIINARELMDREGML